MRHEGRWRAIERAGLALPPLLIALLVWVGGSDVPYWDDWTLAGVLGKAKSGTLALDDILAPHNVHRFVVPKLLLTGVALATGWNIRAQLLADVGIACVTLLLIALIGRRAAPGPARSLALAGSAVAVFSLAQYENWLWAWQAGFFVSVAMIAGAVAALAVPRWRWGVRLAIAAALCVAATFSIGFGVVSWIALAPLVASERSAGGWGAIARSVAVWLALGAATVVAYFGGAPIASGMTPERAGAPEIVRSFLQIAGTPWVSHPAAAALLGALSIALFGVLAARAARADLRASIPWISLGLVALGFAALAAFVRAGSEAVARSRYATPMILLTVASLHLGSTMREKGAKVAGALALLVLWGSLSFGPLFWSTAAARHASRACTDLLFLFRGETADCVSTRHVDAAFLRQVETVRAEGLRRFADASWFTAASDAPQALHAVRRGDQLIVGGSLAPALFPRAVILTRGAARRPVAIAFEEAGGTWSAAAGGDDGSAIDAWLLPLRERRLVHIGRRTGSLATDVERRE